jgi:hypothetical protein
VKSKDAAGSPLETIASSKYCWAQQVDVSGSDEEEGKVRVLFDASFFIKYDKTLIKGQYAGMVVEDEDGFEFDISSIIQIEYKKFLRINAVKHE